LNKNILYKSAIKKYILVIEEGANIKQAVFPCSDWTVDDANEILDSVEAVVIDLEKHFIRLVA